MGCCLAKEHLILKELVIFFPILDHVFDHKNKIAAEISYGC